MSAERECTAAGNSRLRTDCTAASWFLLSCCVVLRRRWRHVVRYAAGQRCLQFFSVVLRLLLLTRQFWMLTNRILLMLNTRVIGWRLFSNTLQVSDKSYPCIDDLTLPWICSTLQRCVEIFRRLNFNSLPFCIHLYACFLHFGFCSVSAFICCTAFYGEEAAIF